MLILVRYLDIWVGGSVAEVFCPLVTGGFSEPPLHLAACENIVGLRLLNSED